MSPKLWGGGALIPIPVSGITVSCSLYLSVHSVEAARAFFLNALLNSSSPEKKNSSVYASPITSHIIIYSTFRGVSTQACTEGVSA